MIKILLTGSSGFVGNALLNTLVKSSEYDIKSVYGFGHQLYYENVIKVLNDKKLPDIDGNQGLQSLKIILAAYLSAEKDKTISLPVEIQ